MKADMIRSLMAGKTKDIATCKWQLDYPKFTTALHRAFALDMAARGTYDNNSTSYNRIKKMIKEFVRLWSDTHHTAGEWTNSTLNKDKNFLCLVFGLGDPCDKCSHHHIDLFDMSHECTIDSGCTKADKS